MARHLPATMNHLARQRPPKTRAWVTNRYRSCAAQLDSVLLGAVGVCLLTHEVYCHATPCLLQGSLYSKVGQGHPSSRCQLCTCLDCILESIRGRVPGLRTLGKAAAAVVVQQ